MLRDQRLKLRLRTQEIAGGVGLQVPQQRVQHGPHVRSRTAVVQPSEQQRVPRPPGLRRRVQQLITAGAVTFCACATCSWVMPSALRRRWIT